MRQTPTLMLSFSYLKIKVLQRLHTDRIQASTSPSFFFLWLNQYIIDVVNRLFATSTSR
jgi:hypothetical protein